MHRLTMVALGIILAVGILPLAGMPETGAQSSYAHPAFERSRDELDRPIDAGQANRTWFWGPAPITEGMYEPYLESSDNQRLVQYIDKARFELTNPDADPNNAWFVSTGLLTRELISGSVQVGHATYEQHEPSDREMAGDAGNAWPTYAGFARVIDQLYADQTGSHATSVFLEAGVSSYPDAENDPGAELVQYLDYAGPGGQVGYNVPAAFWDFMHAPGITWDGVAYGASMPLMDWLFVLGLPISDPFWVSVQLEGEPTWVLVQAFERRVLTYTPSNPEGWQVEMGNVGRHYAEWRHGDEEPVEPGEPEPTPIVPIPPPPVNHDPGESTNYWAMAPGSVWAYQDVESGEYYVVEITGRTTGFIDGEWLLIREESRPDGTREVSYWDYNDSVLWLYGYELFDDEGVLEQAVVYDGPVRYLTTFLDLGQGWGTNTWVEVNGLRNRLVQIAFQITMLREITTPAGSFQASTITATETRTDGDNLYPPQTVLKRFDFQPYYGIVQEVRGDLELELVAYSLN